MEAVGRITARYSARVMVADLGHYLDLPEDTSAPARRLAAHLSDVVRAATASDAATSSNAGTAWQSALPCRRRPAHRTCPGRLVVRLAETDGPIQWQCGSCGDTGTISHWEDSPFDLRRRGLAVAEAVSDTVLTDEVAAALRDLQLLDRECERVVFRTRSHPGGAVLTATDAELEELVGAVAAEANHEPDRRRQQRLDAAFDALNDATVGSW